MASWDINNERTIRGLFMNRFAPKRYRGVTGVPMLMGELVGVGASAGGETMITSILNGRFEVYL